MNLKMDNKNLYSCKMNDIQQLTKLFLEKLNDLSEFERNIIIKTLAISLIQYKSQLEIKGKDYDKMVS